MNNLPPINNNSSVPVCVSNNPNLLLHVNADFAPTNSATSSLNAANTNVLSINPLLTSSASSSSLLNNLASGGCPVFPAAQMNASQTEIKVERVTHHWTVKNFSHCYQEYLENFVTLAKNDETLTWSVKIYPKGNGENNKEFVFLCLNRMVPGSTKFGKVGFKSRFILRNSENKEIEMRVHPNPSHSDYVSYIKRDILFPQISPKDVIVVTVEIDVAVETITTVNTEDAFSVPDPKVQLMNDYEKLFKSQQFCDFVIEVGNRRINAHRCVLGMRSTVFNAMLSHDTEESQKGYCEIKDLDYDVVAEMLYFMYCGKTPRVEELAGDLLIAADKYCIADLKLRSEKALIGGLTIDNACEFLTLADRHAAAHLKEKAVEFVVAHAAHVTRTPGWQCMLRQHPELVTEVVQAFGKPQNDVYCLN